MGKAQYPNHRPIMEGLDNANSIHAFNKFEEEGFVERFQCYFRLVDIPRDAFYALATPAPQEQKFFHPEVNFFMTLNEIMKKLISISLTWVNRFFHQ